MGYSCIMIFSFHSTNQIMFVTTISCTIDAIVSSLVFHLKFQVPIALGIHDYYY
jgi:hypothetical protein